MAFQNLLPNEIFSTIKLGKEKARDERGGGIL